MVKTYQVLDVRDSWMDIMADDVEITPLGQVILNDPLGFAVAIFNQGEWKRVLLVEDRKHGLQG